MSLKKFKIHREIHDRLTKFGLEIYDWGLYIFFTMILILIFKNQIIIAMLADLLFLIFLRNYKKGKPEFYTTMLINYLLSAKDNLVLEPGRDNITIENEYLNEFSGIIKNLRDMKIKDMKNVDDLNFKKTGAI